MSTAQRDAAAVRLRSTGATYQTIADTLGLCARSAAYKSVQRALTACVVESVTELRALELHRLDQLQRAAWGVLDAEHPVVSAGKLVTIDGVPLVDDGVKLHAIDRLLAISARRSKLLGLDSPVRIEAISLSDLDSQIAALTQELERND